MLSTITFLAVIFSYLGLTVLMLFFIFTKKIKSNVR